MNCKVKELIPHQRLGNYASIIKDIDRICKQGEVKVCSMDFFQALSQSLCSGCEANNDPHVVVNVTYSGASAINKIQKGINIVQYL